MKKLVTIVIYLFSIILFGQNNLTCATGNCKNGEGILQNSDFSIINAGIFNNGKLNGAGYKKEKNGNFYYSNFKEDLPTGFSIYYIGEGVKQHGVFKNGLKEGTHVLMYQDLSQYTLINYKNDKEISRTNFTLDINKINQGCQGDCANGFGFMANGEDTLLLGFFKNTVFIRGEVINIAKNSSEFYDFENKEEIKGIYTSQNTQDGFVEDYLVIDYYESKNINKQKSSVTSIKDRNIFIIASFDETGNLKNKVKNY